jgi:Effector protein
MDQITYLLQKVVQPDPPAIAVPDFYGLQWRPGQVGRLQAYLYAQALSGLYIGFPARVLAEANYFGDNNQVLPVYAVPSSPSSALRDLVNQYQTHPPAGQEYNFSNIAPGRLQQLQGFLDYIVTCLNAINQTPDGAQLLAQLSGPGAPRRTLIVPQQALKGNLCRASDAGQCRIIPLMQDVKDLNYAELAEIAAMVDQRYAGLPTGIARYTQLANDIYNMPCYSLFIPQADYTPAFLRTIDFRFHGQPIGGQVLLDWIVNNTGAAFQNFLATDQTSFQDIVLVRFFKAALVIRLYQYSPRGTGTSAVVLFDPCYEFNNNLSKNRTRPPAIGLAHELIHALHSTRGSQAGVDSNSFSTLPYELLASGLGPFAPGQILNLITENTIRAAWGGVANPGPFNSGPVPQRLIYTNPAQVPPNGRTVREMRRQTGTI